MENEEKQQEVVEENEVTLQSVMEELKALSGKFENSEKENAILKDQINKLLLQGKGNGGEVDTRSYDKIVGEIE